MMKVNLDELIRVKRYLKEINSLDLDSINWVVEGKEVKPTESQINEFLCVGFSNTDFPSAMGWYPTGIGIMWTDIFITNHIPIEQALYGDES